MLSVQESDTAHMGRIERSREIARRRTRRVKLKKLRTRFAAAKTPADKEAVAAKARRVSPFVDLKAEAAVAH